MDCGSQQNLTRHVIYRAGVARSTSGRMHPNQSGVPRWTRPAGEGICSNNSRGKDLRPLSWCVQKSPPQNNTSPNTKKGTQTSLPSLFPAIVSVTSQFIPIRHRPGRGGGATATNKDLSTVQVSPVDLSRLCAFAVDVFARSENRFAVVSNPVWVHMPLFLSHRPPSIRFPSLCFSWDLV